MLKLKIVVNLLIYLIFSSHKICMTYYKRYLLYNIKHIYHIYIYIYICFLFIKLLKILLHIIEIQCSLRLKHISESNHFFLMRCTSNYTKLLLYINHNQIYLSDLFHNFFEFLYLCFYHFL